MKCDRSENHKATAFKFSDSIRNAFANLVPRVFLPFDQQPENVCSGRNHFKRAPQMQTAQWYRMGKIRSFQNGCSQSSRFPTAGQVRRRLWEREPFLRVQWPSPYERDRRGSGNKNGLSQPGLLTLDHKHWLYILGTFSSSVSDIKTPKQKVWNLFVLFCFFYFQGIKQLVFQTWRHQPVQYTPPQ